MNLYEQKVAEVWVAAVVAVIKAGHNEESAIITAETVVDKFRKKSPKKVYTVTHSLTGDTEQGTYV